MIDAHLVDTSATRDLAPLLLDAQGRLKVMPSAFYASTTRQERALFGVRHAHYGLPTTELVAWLDELIAGRRAIEIGAGSGVLSGALGIVGTDNRMQEWPQVRAHYERLRQPVIRYGARVRELDAAGALRALRPQVVVASWVTHRYDPSRHAAGGNAHGVLEEAVIEGCETYVFIGNSHVHRDKPIWRLPHTRIEPAWVFSRAHNGSPDFVAVWGRERRLPPVEP